MGYHKTSWNVKIAAVRLYECQLLNLNNIFHFCGFSHHTWYCVLKVWHKNGNVILEAQNLQGCVWTLDWDDNDYLLELFCNNMDYFLDKLLSLLETNHFISVHYTTIFHELKQLNVSQKKTQKHCSRERQRTKGWLYCMHGTVLSRVGRIPQWNVQRCPLCWKALLQVEGSKEAAPC